MSKKRSEPWGWLPNWDRLSFLGAGAHLRATTFILVLAPIIASIGHFWNRYADSTEQHISQHCSSLTAAIEQAATALESMDQSASLNEILACVKAAINGDSFLSEESCGHAAACLELRSSALSQIDSVTTKTISEHLKQLAKELHNLAHARMLPRIRLSWPLIVLAFSGASFFLAGLIQRLTAPEWIAA